MDVIRPLIIAGLVVTEVGLWQWRMVIAARGSRPSAMLLGTLGALLQITAISQVVSNVDDPLSVGAYAVGVGIGVLLGLVAGDRLTPGAVGVTIVTTAADAAAGLWKRGWTATTQAGHYGHRPVTILHLAIDRRHEEQLRRDVAHLTPEGFFSTDIRARPTWPARAHSSTETLPGAVTMNEIHRPYSPARVQRTGYRRKFRTLLRRRPRWTLPAPLPAATSLTEVAS